MSNGNQNSNSALNSFFNAILILSGVYLIFTSSGRRLLFRILIVIGILFILGTISNWLFPNNNRDIRLSLVNPTAELTDDEGLTYYNYDINLRNVSKRSYNHFEADCGNEHFNIEHPLLPGQSGVFHYRGWADIDLAGTTMADCRIVPMDG